MPQTKFSLYKIKHRWLIAAIIFVLTVIFGLLVAYKEVHSGRIYSGVYVGPVKLGGLTPALARKKIQEAADSYIRKDFNFSAPERRVSIEPVIIAPEDPDLYYDLLHFDTEAMVKKAYSVGRTGNVSKDFLDIARAAFKKHEVLVVFRLDRERLGGILKQNFGSMEDPPKDASWTINFVAGEPRFTVNPESGGYVFDYSLALRSLEESIAAIKPEEIKIEHKGAKPKITSEDANSLIDEAKAVLMKSPVAISVESNDWKIYQEVLGSWLTINKRDQTALLAVNPDLIKQYLKNRGQQFGLEHEPKNAKFKLKDGKVSEFLSSVDGKSIATPENVKIVSSAVLKKSVDEKISLKVETVEPEFRTDEVNTYGIKEAIGKATTSFAGSPKNRRFNIKVAVEKLNGLLIPPEEEFSLVRAIGAVNEETGFKEELVIKGNKTTPEFGGGLCQIASTVFRSALGTGLPILERQNHSYRVPYYEPPIGMDATIYLPKPDLRFKNDTGAAILVLANVAGDYLTFEFWGTNDGRRAEMSQPVITNVVPPPPPKLILTEDLPPGVKKCTERAHVGSDASFTYTVTRADGTKEEKVFRSHYRPWQEVCLLGVAPGTATSTERTAATE